MRVSGVMAIWVHGGVSGSDKTPVDLAEATGRALSAATALDAVEAALQVLEDDPLLNAGFGSVLTRRGTLEMDAGIAEGSSGRVGAVAGVRVRHPISLARRVMDDTPHVFLAGDGAEEVAPDLEKLEETSPEQVRRWQEEADAGRLDPRFYGSPDQVDTVGAVAVVNGVLAAGSSTGGVLGKLRGRVGDAPIFGAGIYASHAAAVVGTGVGEFFIETLASFRVGRLVEDGAHPQEACEQVIELIGRRRRTAAGLLAVDLEGRVGAAFRGASWSVAGPDGPVAAKQLD